MSIVPEELQEGYVVARWIQSVTRGNEPHSIDKAVIPQGAVIFNKVAKNEVFVDPDPGPNSFYGLSENQVKASLDKDGQLMDDSSMTPGLWLTTGFYTVRAIIDGSLWPIGPIEVTTDHDRDNPLDLLEYTTQVEIPDVKMVPSFETAIRAEEAAKAAEKSAEKAEDARNDINNVVFTADIETLPAGSEATVDVTGEAPNIHLEFGQPISPQGLSAYEIAVDNGFLGTEQQWLDSLHGEDGNDGHSPELTWQGTHLAVDGVAGPDLKGEKGEDSNVPGPTPEISVTATSLPPGSAPTAGISGPAESPTINFGLVEGQQGVPGNTTPEFINLAQQVRDDAIQVDEDKTAAASSASAASDSADAAATSAVETVAARDAAIVAKDDAETARDGAMAAKDLAVAARDTTLTAVVIMGVGRPDVPATLTTPGTAALVAAATNGAYFRSTDGGNAGLRMWRKQGTAWVVTESDRGLLADSAHTMSGLGIHPALEQVYDRCWRDTPSDLDATTILTDSGHSWERIVGTQNQATIRYLASRGPLRIGGAGSNTLAPEGYLIGGFAADAPFVEVTFRALSPHHWQRFLVLKWIDAENNYILRIEDRSLSALVTVAGVTTTVGLMDGGSGLWPRTALNLPDVTTVAARVIRVHSLYATSSRAIEVLWNGHHYGAPIPTESWLPAPGKVGWLTGAGDHIFRFRAGSSV